MSIQRVINNIFRQNFRDPAILGRTLFSVGLLIIGLEEVLHTSSYAADLPDYLPMASLLTLLIGIIFAGTGFMMLANIAVKKAVRILTGLFIFLIVLAYLPVGDVSAIVEALVFIGGALLVSVTAERTIQEIEETKENAVPGNTKT